ncbi:MAG TPA: formate dehydrogenase accessory sulfurtransferase FdhD [Vicinamibacterales bacterium]|jgi:FdhD protein
MEQVAPVDVIRVRGGERTAAADSAAAEEPMEVRLHDRPFAVIMRTPGADLELAAGFLLAERLISGADDLATIEHCADNANVVNVTLQEAIAARVERALAERRNVVANTSCGLCGRVTIDSLRDDAAPLAGALSLSAGVVAAMPASLRAAQPLFDATGGLHAAGLFRSDGALVTSAEDVGRHNAVDKVIGRLLLREQLPASSLALCVSGRTSFEIVQKAWFAGIPALVAVSAPSSLAVSLAREAGITLIGFVRDGAFNIYSNAQRITA